MNVYVGLYIYIYIYIYWESGFIIGWACPFSVLQLITVQYWRRWSYIESLDVFCRMSAKRSKQATILDAIGWAASRAQVIANCRSNARYCVNWLVLFQKKIRRQMADRLLGSRATAPLQVRAHVFNTGHSAQVAIWIKYCPMQLQVSNSASPSPLTSRETSRGPHIGLNITIWWQIER